MDKYLSAIIFLAICCPARVSGQVYIPPYDSAGLAWLQDLTERESSRMVLVCTSESCDRVQIVQPLFYGDGTGEMLPLQVLDSIYNGSAYVQNGIAVDIFNSFNLSDLAEVSNSTLCKYKDYLFIDGELYDRKAYELSHAPILVAMILKGAVLRVSDFSGDIVLDPSSWDCGQ